MTGHAASQGPPLPVRPRPRRGETADSYLRRLAAANHLRFTYLRRYLATPRGSYGPIDPGRVAILAAREPNAILRAFPELAPAAPRPDTRRYTRRKSSGTTQPGGRSRRDPPRRRQRHVRASDRA
jgi:hypothetical protein